MDIYPGFNNGLDAPSLVRMRALFAGTVIFNAGFLCYVCLTFSSLRRLACLPRNNSVRKLLLPYTTFLFLIDTAFAILQDVMIEGVMVEGRLNKEWTETLGCNAALVFRAVFAAVSIFANDLLFLYRVAILVQWQIIALILPCIAFGASFVVGISFLVEFRDILCTSADGFPLGLMAAVGMTVVTNIMLGAMMAEKLHEARRAAQAIAEGSGRSTMSHKRRYMRIAIFVSESAILWIVTAVLNIASTLTPSMMDMSPFFELLFAITAMLSPALLTYQIVLEKTRRSDFTQV